MENSDLDNQKQNKQERLEIKEQINLSTNNNKIERVLFGEQWLADSLKEAYSGKGAKFIEFFNLIDPRILRQPSLKKAFLWIKDNTYGFISDLLISSELNEQMRILSSIYRKPAHPKEAYK